MPSQEVLLEVRNRVATITFNRPEWKNALNQSAVKALLAHLKRVGEDPDIWIAVFRGTADSFCTGHDLKELADETHKVEITFDHVYDTLRNTYKPVIAAINGTCVAGGSGIVLCSDLRIMARSARLGWPQVKRGLSSISGPVMLARAVPLHRAFEIMFRGQFIDAARARALDLVNEVVPDDELDAAVERLTTELLQNAPLAMRAMKQATIKTLDLPYAEAMRHAQVILDGLLANSEDTREGLRAFAEKRAPVWKAR